MRKPSLQLIVVEEIVEQGSGEAGAEKAGESEHEISHLFAS